MRTGLPQFLGRCFAAWALFQGGVALAAPACAPAEWPLWEDFQQYFVQADGRVLDASTPRQHSSSEGQSYGMFFALAAGDRPVFDRLWAWTLDNLIGSPSVDRLPAWIWGHADDGHWRIIDANSASDADLWFAYALLEAGRAWGEPRYVRQAHRLLDLIEAQEVVELPGFGPMLMPGREWFVRPEEDAWQLNPSYLPIPLLRRLALARPQGPWQAIAANTAAMMTAVSPQGFAPDWTRYRLGEPRAAFVIDPIKGPTGSYDAIRTYLWAGMTSPHDPLQSRMLRTLDGMAEATRDDPAGIPPEKADTSTGETSGSAPFGFSAALMPYFKAKGQSRLLERQTARVAAMLRATVPQGPLAQGHQPPYYDYVLSLFGTGWLEGRFRFQADGSSSLSWEGACATTSK